MLLAMKFMKLNGKSQTETIEWVDTILTKKQIISKEWEQYKSAVIYYGWQSEIQSEIRP